ncbi:MAG: zf-HC2 domain-containing protein [Pyrinomonadaceae bacterium]
MRQETNNEMDLLLRRLSRRGDGGGRDGGTGPGDPHLDVDELSSYAQNVLPAAARARYTEHLSECVSCRKLVTELALSHGAVTAAAPVKTGIAATGLKAFLASLLSPIVLRYAVPALGVILVMVVGFVALRRQQRDEFVAQVGVEQKQRAQTVEPGSVPPTPPQAVEGFHDSNQSKPENQQSPVNERGERRRDDVSEGAATGAAAAPVTRPDDEVSTSETRPAAAAAEAAPAPPKVAATTEETKETSKDKKAEAPPKKQPETHAFVTDGSKADANKPGTATANEATARRVSELPVQNRGPRDLQALRPAAGARDDKKTSERDAAETRSVAGRTFKKERGIWVDTAYDSSTGTRNLARGSESFRALVADEPAINTIAEKLDGEVIVVWKGRAYRIR